MHVADDGASGGDLANSRVFTVLRLLATSSYHNYMQLCMCMLHLPHERQRVHNIKVTVSCMQNKQSQNVAIAIIACN